MDPLRLVALCESRARALGLGREDAEDVGVEAATRILTRSSATVVVTAAVVRVVVGNLIKNRARDAARECRTPPPPGRAPSSVVEPDVDGLATAVSLEIALGTPVAMAVEMVAMGYDRPAVAAALAMSTGAIARALGAAATVATTS